MKKTKRVLAMAMAVAMACSMNVFAGSDPWTGADDTDNYTGSKVEGASTVVAPVYRLVLPSTLNFKLDPFERTTSTIYNGSGINAGYGYPVINRSNVDVKVGVRLTLETKPYDTELTSGPAMVTPSALEQNNADNVQPEFFMYAVPFKTQTGITTLTHTGFSKSTYATAPDSMVMLTTSSSGADITSWAGLEFRLKAATYEDYLDGTETKTRFKSYDIANGVSGYTLYGKLNPLAEWADGDISLIAEYELTGITPAIYTATTLKADGMNLATAQHANDVVTKGYLPQPITTGTSVVVTSTADGAYTFDNAFELGQQVIAVKVTTTTDGTDKVIFNGKPAAPYTWTAATAAVKGKFNIARTAAATLGSNYKIEVQFTNGTWMTLVKLPA